MDKKWIWPFELEEQLGAGGMGVVYKARYVGNDRRVAVKILPDHVAANPVLAARFAREMEILKDLKHPHIVHCFGGTTEGKQWFYAMELVEGGSIESLLKEKGKLPWEEVIEYGKQMCAALEHAHTHNVIHRDIKPANVLLSKAGKVKLADFGLALVADGDKLTAAGKTMGTFLYMSPEQIRGKPPLSGQSDLYALGCVLFEMLTGAAPFQGANPGEVLHKHVHEPPPRVLTQALDCPLALEEVVLNLLAKTPAERPATARDVSRRLSGIDTVVVVDRARKTPARSLAETKSAVAVGSGKQVPVRRPAEGSWPLNLWLTGGLAALCFGITWEAAKWRADAAYRRAESLWVQGLTDQNAAVRGAAARSLGELGPLASATVPQLASTIEDADWNVRAEAVSALGRLGHSARPELPKIRRLLKEDPEPGVRHAAETAVGLVESSRGEGMGYGWILWLAAFGVTGWGVWRQFRP
jgi:eukaryotic-like serine/threonine-protein kinase